MRAVMFPIPALLVCKEQIFSEVWIHSFVNNFFFENFRQGWKETYWAVIRGVGWRAFIFAMSLLNGHKLSAKWVFPLKSDIIRQKPKPAEAGGGGGGIGTDRQEMLWQSCDINCSRRTMEQPLLWWQHGNKRQKNVARREGTCLAKPVFLATAYIHSVRWGKSLRTYLGLGCLHFVAPLILKTKSL